MRTKFYSILSFALVLGLLGCGSTEAIESASNFSLNDTNGKAHQLSDYRGKYVVLEWFNPDCPFVKKHYDSGNMQSLQEKYTQKGVVWLSINSSAKGKQGHYSPSEYNTIIKKFNSSQSALLLDHDGTVGRQYSAKTTPHMYIVDPDGDLIYQGAIDSNSSWSPDVIPSSTNYVSQALDEAMNGNKVSEPVTKPYGCSVKY